MEKKLIIQDIKNSFEGASFLNVNEIAKYLGMSRNTVPKLLEGIDYIQFGHQRKYLAGDLAARIIEIRRM